MRKNGVNRELVPVDGGVCAPAGFSANGVYCGISQKTTIVSRETETTKIREDLALIVAEKRVPTACVCASGQMTGAPVRVTKKHLRSGYARAAIVNSGIANVFSENGEELAENICAALAKRAKISADEVAIASTGEIGKPLPFEPIEAKLGELVAGLGTTDEHSLAAARGIMTTDRYPKRLSYAFELGDYTCKIGAIFKGNTRVCPNMATTLCFLTTDVRISPAALQKALSSAVGNTLNILDLDGVSSPNDLVCIMASGRAGNWEIDRADGDFKKFCYALGETLTRVCLELAKDGEDGGKAFVCKISGARSQRAARAVARSVAAVSGLKNALLQGKIDLETLLCAVWSSGEVLETDEIEISVGSAKGELVVFEDGKAMPVSRQTLSALLDTDELELCVRLGKGNYTATSISRAG